MRVRTLATAFALLALAGNAAAAPTDKPGRCFSTTNFNNWKAGEDGKTIYIRVGMHDYYRLDLSSTCSALRSPNPFLVTQWRGTNFVCSAIDWDLKVSRGSGLGAEPCIVRAMTPLSRAEADAIPRKFKP